MGNAQDSSVITIWFACFARYVVFTRFRMVSLVSDMLSVASFRRTFLLRSCRGSSPVANFQINFDAATCHVAKVKAAASAHSMADAIPFK